MGVAPERGRWRPVVVVFAATAVLAFAYTLGGPDPYTWVKAGVAGATGIMVTLAVAVGLARYRPEPRWPWLMIAATALLDAVIRITFTAMRLTVPLDANGVRAVPIYVLQFAMSASFVAALLGIGWQHGARALPTIIDGAIVVLGSGLLAWVAVARPWTLSPNLGVVEAGSRTAFVARDVIILAALAWLLTSVRMNGAVGLLTLAVGVDLTYTTAFELHLARGGALPTGVLESLWLGFHAGLAAAAVVPSMASISSRRQPADGTGLPALVLVSVSALVPVALLFSRPRGRDPASVIDAVELGAATMLILVLARLTLAAIQLRRSLDRAAVVGDASTALVSVTGVGGIEKAVDAASRQLLRSRNRSARLIGVPDSDIPGETRDEATAPDPTSTALRIPLDPHADDSGAALLVQGPRRAIVANRSALAVVAAQASLALARTRLTDEISETRRDRYFRALVQNSTDVILIVGDHGRIRYASPSAAKLFPNSTVDGRRLPALIAEPDRSEANALCTAMQQRQPVAQPSTVHGEWRVEGSPERRVEVSCVDLRGEPAVDGVVVTLRDVTERRQLEERLTALALHDPLTGLGNRALFMTAVENAVAQAPDTSAVLFIDLDDFKVVNDTFGHVLGDALLRETAARIRTATNGLAARVGGDEFAVLATDITDPTEIDHAGERIVAALSQPLRVDREVIVGGASVGAATAAEADGAEELLRRADVALYAAKTDGKRRFRRYDVGMVQTAAERLRLRSALAESLEGGALALVFQPIVALDTGATVGFEAQLEWRIGDQVVDADELREIAEDGGLSAELGDWVLRAALPEAARWADAAAEDPPYVSVTLTRGHLAAGGALERVQRHLADAGLPPELLVLEIADDLLRSLDDGAAAGLRDLRALGVRIAVDGFGAGYGEPGALHDIPLDLVRLDKFLTRTLSCAGQESSLVAGLVRLARALRLDVVATGVETGDEFGLARLAGCPYGQGRAVSGALGPEAALRWTALGRVRPRQQPRG